MSKLRVVLDPGAFLPKRAHDGDAGLDLYSPVDALVPPRGSWDIDTGVHVAIPYGWVGFLKSKSGLLFKYGIQTEGVVDSGYVGSIHVLMQNHRDEYYSVHRGDKISQLVILPCALAEPVEVDALEDTERGSGGFGSTGV